MADQIDVIFRPWPFIRQTKHQDDSQKGGNRSSDGGVFACEAQKVG
jgi:hypothetical protein